jgi:hypothetical protein
MSDEWPRVGRELLHGELSDRRFELDAAFRDAEGTLAGHDTGTPYAGDLDADDVRALRQALNRARRVVETYAVRVVDGVEPWGDPRPQMPYDVLYEMSDHPRADGVGPREYVDAKQRPDTDLEGEDE